MNRKERRNQRSLIKVRWRTSYCFCDYRYTHKILRIKLKYATIDSRIRLGINRKVTLLGGRCLKDDTMLELHASREILIQSDVVAEGYTTKLGIGVPNHLSFRFRPKVVLRAGKLGSYTEIYSFVDTSKQIGLYPPSGNASKSSTKRKQCLIYNATMLLSPSQHYYEVGSNLQAGNCFYKPHKIMLVFLKTHW